MSDVPNIVQPYPDNESDTRPPRTWHYSVVWAPHYNETEDHLARVQIIDGYSTFSDLQRIIAIPRGLTRDQVVVKSVRLSDVTRDPV